MPTYTCDYRLPSGNRAQKRQALISCFLNEEAGIGRGDDVSRTNTMSSLTAIMESS